jgi:anti-sigma factor RsiW
MKCKDFERLMPEYWEDQLTEIERYQMDQHTIQCSSCRREYILWEESEKLIRNSSLDFQTSSLQFTISDEVMSRIYTENAWAAPVAKKPFLLTDQFRSWVSGISSALFIVFMASILLSSTMTDANSAYGEDIFAKKHHLVGIQPVGSAADLSDSEENGKLFYGVVASIGEPASLPPQDGWLSKTYVISFSLLGLAFIVIAMSWISRVKSY